MRRLLFSGLLLIPGFLSAQRTVIDLPVFATIGEEPLATSLRSYGQQVGFNANLSPKRARSVADSLLTLMEAYAPSDPRQLTWHVLRGHTFVRGGLLSEAFPDLRRAVDLAQRADSKGLAPVLALSIFAGYLEFHGSYHLAVNYAKAAIGKLNDARHDQPVEFVHERQLYNLILRNFSANNQPDSAYAYLQLIIAKLPNELPAKSRGNLLNDGGIFLTQAGKYTEAIAAFEEAIALLCPGDNDNFQFLCVNVQESKAHALIATGQFNEGIQLLQQAYKTRQALGRYAPAMQALAYLIQYNLDAGNVPEALRIFEREYDYFMSKTDVSHNSYKLYRELGALYRRLERPELAIKYEDVYLRYAADHPTDIASDQERRQLRAFLTMQRRTEQERERFRQLEESRHLDQLRIRNLWLTIVGGVLAISLAGLLLHLRNQRKNRSHAQRLLVLENENLQLAARDHQRELERFDDDHRMRNTLRRQFLQQLDELDQLPAEAVEQRLQALRRELTASVLQGKAPTLLQQRVTAVNKHFEDGLRERVAGITPEEIQMCSLIRIGLDNQQLGRLLNASDETVRAMKFALRKKAGWTPREMEKVLNQTW